MKGYNLPDNVSPSDPEAPWNKEEREEEDEGYFPDSEEENDLLALLYEAEDSLKQSQYIGVSYTKSWATVHCQCGRTYKGLMTHVLGMDNLYDNYQSHWCPGCIRDQAAEWWKGCFRMEQVETVQNTNRLEEDYMPTFTQKHFNTIASIIGNLPETCENCALQKESVCYFHEGYKFGVAIKVTPNGHCKNWRAV